MNARCIKTINVALVMFLKCIYMRFSSCRVDTFAKQKEKKSFFFPILSLLSILHFFRCAAWVIQICSAPRAKASKRVKNVYKLPKIRGISYINSIIMNKKSNNNYATIYVRVRSEEDAKILPS